MSWRSRFRGGRARLNEVAPLNGDVVMRPVSAMRSGQVVACSVSLVAAGVLLARGFIGVVPGRPVWALIGLGLAASAILGLAIDHVDVRSKRESPDHVLIQEVSRCRRFGHPLSLVSLPCTPETGHRVIGRMRGTDRAWRQRGSIIAMLAETDPDGSADFVRRVSDLVPVDKVRVATFPNDAVTVDGLYAALKPVPQHLRPLPITDEVGREGSGLPAPTRLAVVGDPADGPNPSPDLAVGEG